MRNRFKKSLFLQLQQVGIHVFHNKGIGPEAGLDVHLRVNCGILGADGHLQVAALSAHTHSGVNIVGTELDGNAQQLLVADKAIRLAVQKQAESAGDSVGRTLTVDVDASLFLDI